MKNQNLTDEQKQILADANKSEQEILNEMLDRSAEMEEALEDVFSGLTNPLIIQGPPGVGKSKGVEIASQQCGIKSTDLISSSFRPWTKDEIKNGQPPYPWSCEREDVINGALIRGADYGVWQMVTDLYANKDKGVLVIDDNDEILKDTVAMAILMKACEQEADKTIVYGKAESTTELQLRGVPARFNTSCPVIILSNIDFGKHIKHNREKEARTGRPVPGYIARWEALMNSRGKYINLAMNTGPRIRIWCEDLIQKTKMLTNSKYLAKTVGRSCTKDESRQVIEWVRHNQPQLSTRLDLRTYNKVALKIIKKANKWKQSAKLDLLRVV